MKIYTKIVIDISTGETLSEESYEYDGEIAWCNGDMGGDSSAGESEAGMGGGDDDDDQGGIGIGPGSPGFGDYGGYGGDIGIGPGSPGYGGQSIGGGDTGIGIGGGFDAAAIDAMNIEAAIAAQNMQPSLSFDAKAGAKGAFAGSPFGLPGMAIAGMFAGYGRSALDAFSNPVGRSSPIGEPGTPGYGSPQGAPDTSGFGGGGGLTDPSSAPYNIPQLQSQIPEDPYIYRQGSYIPANYLYGGNALTNPLLPYDSLYA